MDAGADQGSVRAHPVVGAFFIVASFGFLALGAFSSNAPGPLRGLPLPPEIVMPFLFWLAAVWCLMFGFFFIRPRSSWHGRQRAVARP